jgi:hypothetical protein
MFSAKRLATLWRTGAFDRMIFPIYISSIECEQH